ncbi:MAG: stage V sporulation protein AC [Acutalibacter sp.]|nr:stage V sporulation protein AC [Acutalibacter sp.]
MFMRTVTPQEYAQKVKEASPPSPVVKDCCLAFLCGGAVCTLGQVLCQCYQNLGLDLPQARMAVSISLILLSASLTALGWYDNIAKHAGAGVLVPITGFANSMVSPAMEFKSEGFITGLGAKLFTVAGPVLVFGVTASVVYGLVIFFFQI